jgi:hypothetical protein
MNVSDIKKVLKSFGIDERILTPKNIAKLQKICENPNNFSPEKLNEIIQAFSSDIIDITGRNISDGRNDTGGRKVGRNNSCICGSGQKYKKCCL